MVDMDEDQAPAGGTLLDKAWAIAGLMAAAALAWMAIDLLRGPRAPAVEADTDVS
jgi:hypothetical protein